MERTNAFVVKWQTGRNGDTFHGWAIHGILVDTKKRCSLKKGIPTDNQDKKDICETRKTYCT